MKSFEELAPYHRLRLPAALGDGAIIGVGHWDVGSSRARLDLSEHKDRERLAGKAAHLYVLWRMRLVCYEDMLCVHTSYLCTYPILT